MSDPIDRLYSVTSMVGGFAQGGTTMSPNETQQVYWRLREAQFDLALRLVEKSERIERLVHALVTAGLEVPK